MISFIKIRNAFDQVSSKLLAVEMIAGLVLLNLTLLCRLRWVWMKEWALLVAKTVAVIALVYVLIILPLGAFMQERTRRAWRDKNKERIE